MAWYLHTASAANAVVAPQRDSVPLEPLPPGRTPLAFRDIRSALDWCSQERTNIVVATRQASSAGLHDMAWKLPVAVLGRFNTSVTERIGRASHLVALSSARQAGDRQAEAWVLNNLGMVCIQQRMDEAIDYFDQALAIRRDLGDRRGEAQVANNLADAYIELGRAEDALEPLRRVLSLQIEVGHRYGQGVALNNLGEAYLELGRPENAIDDLIQARSIFVETTLCVERVTPRTISAGPAWIWAARMRRSVTSRVRWPSGRLLVSVMARPRLCCSWAASTAVSARLRTPGDAGAMPRRYSRTWATRRG